MLSEINAYQRVELETRVMGASPQQLILIMLEEIGCLLTRANIYISEGNIAKRWAMLSKAISIINIGLRSALDHTLDSDIPGHFERIYEYMVGKLFQANSKNDSEMIDSVIRLNNELIETWKDISLSNRDKSE